jgi:hypothetical protein
LWNEGIIADFGRRIVLIHDGDATKTGRTKGLPADADAEPIMVIPGSESGLVESLEIAIGRRRIDIRFTPLTVRLP